MLITFVATPLVWAAEGEGGGGGHGSEYAMVFMWVAVIIVLAKLSNLIEYWGQPAVLGELLIGVIFGNLLALYNPEWYHTMVDNNILNFMAELGVVILLFQVGLESNLKEMAEVGVSAGLVAIVGVVLPFAMGAYLIGPFLMPELTSNEYLFLGAALTATSVGITARVFRDLGQLQSSEAKIVLGAAVIDDVLGLIVLAVVSAIVQFGEVGTGQVIWIFAKAVIFLGATAVLGQLLAPYLSQGFSRINPGIGMKFTLALALALLLAWLAQVIGLAPIVGAFAAGLILEPVHFRHFKDAEIIDHLRATIHDADCSVREQIDHVLDEHAERHVEELLEPLGYTLVPIFFVLTGMIVNLQTLFNPATLLVAVAVTIAAFIGKIIAGYVVLDDVNRAIIGWGMAPRGEVGLIFATIGRSLGVVNDAAFSVIIFMVIFTTLLTPPILTHLLRKQAVEG